MTADQQTALIRRMLVFMERTATKAGHLAMIEPNEHLGVCNTKRRYVGGTRVRDGSGFRMDGQTLNGECTPSCQEFRAVLTAAREHVAATAPRQLSLEGAA